MKFQRPIKPLPNLFTVAPGVWGMKDIFVNFYMVQNLENEDWFLIDSGLRTSFGKIKKMATHLFGEGAKPAGIILTHGHFDHVGSVYALAEEWDVPVYAHTLEVPYLTGQSCYPPADPTVGGGIMANLSFVYPTKPINIWRHLHALANDEIIPGMHGWKFIHTPGHSAGHISLFRAEDKVLLAGDAFVTTKPESATATMLQLKKLSGPPKYFTTDWRAAENSVKQLADLQAITAATGHGRPMRGSELQMALAHLKNNFKTEAVPHQGRYVSEAAITDTHGVVYIPPKSNLDNSIAWKAFGITSLLVLSLFINGKQKKKKRIKSNYNLLDVEYNF